MNKYKVIDSTAKLIVEGNKNYCHAVKRIKESSPYERTKGEKIKYKKEIDIEFQGKLFLDNNFEPKDFVHYTNGVGEKERGRIKAKSGYYDKVFVVYHCNNEWDNFHNYTAALTSVDDLTKINN